jgi:hypothetical protein
MIVIVVRLSIAKEFVCTAKLTSWAMVDLFKAVPVFYRRKDYLGRGSEIG